MDAERIVSDARALEGYRAAVSFIGADSWDGYPDCIEILRAARMADHDWHWTPDETAEALKRLRAHLISADTAQLPPTEDAG